MDVYRGLNQATNTWSAITVNMDYKERIAYDANGNILKYLRNGTSAVNTSMDSLSYKYYSLSNRLKQVKDSVGDSNYTEDIDNQTSTGNYTYDEISNLVTNGKEGITAVIWNVYGKIRRHSARPRWPTRSPISDTPMMHRATGSASGCSVLRPIRYSIRGMCGMPPAT